MVTDNAHVVLISTGGTIAAQATADGAVPILSADDLLGSVPAGTADGPMVSTVDLMSVDSSAMRVRDQFAVVAAVADALADPAVDGVVVTHGTDTMSETARYLAEHADVGQKTVVLTGAMQPAVMARSDAGFNLGAALSAVNLLPPGVYISMSGRIFPAASVCKDRARGIFEG